MRKKNRSWERFFLYRSARRHRLRAQFVILQVEEVGVEGLLTSGQILLLVESSAVGLQGGEVLHTSLSGGGCLSEARAELQLVGRRRGTALYLLPQVQTVTMVVLRRCRTVSGQQHLVARVLTALARLRECAGYAIDTGTENYICHVACGYGSTRTERRALIEVSPCTRSSIEISLH